jgi:hypothetical protein
MDTIERDIKILDKLLNSKLFLKRYPMVERVSVTKYGNGIDIVIFPDETKRYFDVRKEIGYYIWDISRLASVETFFNIYP